MSTSRSDDAAWRVLITCGACQKGPWELLITSSFGTGMGAGTCPYCACRHFVTKTVRRCYKCAKTYDLIRVDCHDVTRIPRVVHRDNSPSACPYCGAAVDEPLGPYSRF